MCGGGEAPGAVRGAAACPPSPLRAPPVPAAHQSEQLVEWHDLLGAGRRNERRVEREQGWRLWGARMGAPDAAQFVQRVRNAMPVRVAALEAEGRRQGPARRLMQLLRQARQADRPSPIACLRCPQFVSRSGAATAKALPPRAASLSSGLLQTWPKGFETSPTLLRCGGIAHRRLLGLPRSPGSLTRLPSLPAPRQVLTGTAAKRVRGELPEVGRRPGGLPRPARRCRPRLCARTLAPLVQVLPRCLAYAT